MKNTDYGVILLLAVVVPYLITLNSPGLGLFVGFVVMVASVIFLYREKMQRNWLSLFSLANGLLLLLSFAVYDQSHLTGIRIFVAILLLLFGLWLSVSSDNTLSLRGLLQNFFRRSRSMVLDLTLLSDDVSKRLQQTFDQKTKVIKKSHWQGVLIALFVGPLLAYMLSQADPVFASFFQDAWVWTVVKDIVSGLSIAGIFRFLFYFFVLASLGLYFQSKKTNFAECTFPWYEESTLKISLWVLTLLYGLFCAIQIRYLFLGTALPEGFTYSSYAVQGFRELFVVSLINAGIFMYFSNRKKTTQTNRLISLLTILSIIIAGSALKRLLIYVGIYGLTFLRLLPGTFIVVIILGFICMLLWRHNYRRMLHWLFVLVVTWFTLFSWVGVDRLIAKYNIQQYIEHQDKKLDLNYLLFELSFDSWLVVSEYLDLLGEEERVFLVKANLTGTVQGSCYISSSFCEKREFFTDLTGLDSLQDDLSSWQQRNLARSTMSTVLDRWKVFRESRSSSVSINMTDFLQRNTVDESFR